MANQPSTLPQLTREEMTPPVIQPVPPGIKRPRWSVMIPTYNCARFLRETIESVLSQDIDPAEMQIEVIDDCSTTDDPEAVVREFGQGRVRFYRKPANAGAIPNFNTCIERSTGHYVHILHGDDIIYPGFYGCIDSMIISNPDKGLFASRAFYINEEGHITAVEAVVPGLDSGKDSSAIFAGGSYIATPAIVVKRSAYERQGAFLPCLVHCADAEVWSRIIHLEGGVQSQQVLAGYRVFEGNDSSKLMRSGENIYDHLRLIAVMKQRGVPFDLQALVSNLQKTAFTQSLHFAQIGDRKAFNANRVLLSRLSRLRENVKYSIAIAKSTKSLKWIFA